MLTRFVVIQRHRFMKFEDRKRALVSRMLQYGLVHKVLGIPYKDVIIRRTVEGKPSLEHNHENFEFPNFNFNASHHGDYVAIASEPLCIVGIDIVSHDTPKYEDALDFIANFSSHLTSLEWKNIMNAGSTTEMMAEFYRYWCLKEAYIKAIGIGLGYDLSRLEFYRTDSGKIRVRVDGEDSEEWRFWLCELDIRHFVCVARGNPKRAVESYKRTLCKTDFDESEYRSALNIPNKDFVLCDIREFIPESRRGEFDSINNGGGS
ncbi:L-aminoadipate-semialdehyde dehydrogenase-phosphopantetheinyl transferase [Amborella trichopoda]|nr:L-aminoadipate-semialdehyde dehydrogenase-phosphopantetheinyl transferase [Amborella trichopoda]|eukprot:XP_006832865.2 L-aminoadipate-semialdehyde dehydrogenase-phosphopantetheinyl transferase [Amborella trichopoda]